MRTRSRNLFTTVHTEGGLLPADLLARIVQGNKQLDGLTPAAYHLADTERLAEAVGRSWTRLRQVWAAFRESLAKLPENDLATSLTRERWLLILFQELGYGRLQTARDLAVDGQSYPISHLWQRVPLHLVGARVELDSRTPGAAGAARMSPHGLVQDFLNKSDDHSWGFVSNGRRLRLLRDNASMTRQAFVEFDLDAMFTGEVYPDFALLWLVAHQSRLEGEKLEDFWLERWAREAREIGTRALDALRGGVEEAIRALGRGFLAHPKNTALKAALRSGALGTQDYYRELLRLVYRLIFLFAAEDRRLLFAPSAPIEAKDRYARHYSTERLRRIAERMRGSRHGDHWEALQMVMGFLGSDEGCPSLALPALGSFLWSRDAIGHLSDTQLANVDLLDAVRALSFTSHEGVRRPVDYKSIGAEELGSVYESLLELHPVIDADRPEFTLSTAAGHERKTTGSYYTPDSLVQCLLDSALDPVLDEAARKPNAEQAILALKVCDPACGSGHFLIAAAHRIARRLASVRTGDVEPSPDAVRAALRDVIGHCIYGVDLNPMAVELCKVSLWLESIDPGKPLSFLDHRILVGNSLLGATPALIEKGIPDVALEPIEGDDKVIARELKRRNREEREGQGQLFSDIAAEATPLYGGLEHKHSEIDALDDRNVAGVRGKERRFRDLRESSEYAKAKLLADAWCAAFVWRKTREAPPAVTHRVFQRLLDQPDLVLAAVRAETARIASVLAFFHWHLEFPEVFRVATGRAPENEQAGWSGGFDAVLGNPPWERIKLQEQEWFAERAPAIADAPNAAARRRLIEALPSTEPALHRSYLEAIRAADAESVLVRSTGRFPLCGRGDVNTYTVFAETMRCLIGPRGRLGCIVPSGIATDDTTKVFFQDIMDAGSLVTLYDFVNDAGLFPGVGHGRFKFCLLTLRATTALAGRSAAEFAFQLSRVDDLRDSERVFELSAQDIALLNPNTRTCPVFRTRRDAEVTKAIYRRVPVLIKEGPPEENHWGTRIRTRLWHMSEDAAHFRTLSDLERESWTRSGNSFERRGVRYVPLYEAKMVHQFDHRYGDYADHPAGSENTSLPDVALQRLVDPSYAPSPRYWVPADEVEARLNELWQRPFLLGWRDICRSTDERTLIASVLPRYGCGDKFLLMFPEVDSCLTACLLANLNAIALDFVARQKVGGSSMKAFTMRQLPVLPPRSFAGAGTWCDPDSLRDWICSRVLELVYTAHDLAPFARACGFDGPPFRWDPERRFQLRCELDAAFFHLYGLSRDDTAYILDTFPIVRRNDEAKYGSYRTKTRILELYDEYAAAGEIAEAHR
jgi:hypothetical protein